jgi:hypothetical protein
MAKYIDSDALKKQMASFVPFVIDASNQAYADGLTDAYSLICQAPAADVVEVVRCADCKWFQCNMRQDGYLPHNVSEYECRHWCGPCDPTDYCSYGEPPKEES